MDGETEAPNERYKVGKVVSKHGLDDLHAELPARWVGDGRESQSLRDLADEINTAILGAVMDDAGLDPLEGEVQNAYRLLTGDDVSAGMRTQQRNRLEHEGVDVDALEDDFVTHQAVYMYLKEALGVSKDSDESTAGVEKHSERINRLRSRTEAVTQGSLEALAGDEITLGDHDAIVDIQVYCHDCGTQSDVATLLEAGGCDCAE